MPFSCGVPSMTMMTETGTTESLRLLIIRIAPSGTSLNGSIIWV